MAAPAAQAQAGFRSEAALERAQAHAGRRRDLRPAPAPAGQIGGAPHRLAGRLGQIEGRRIGAPEFLADQQRHCRFGGAAAVEHPPGHGPQHQLAQQRRHRDGHAVARQPLRPFRLEIEGAERARRGKADAVPHARRHPHRPAAGRDPRTPLGPDLHHPGSGMDQLVPVMRMRRDRLAGMMVARRRADQQKGLVGHAAPDSRHHAPL